MSKTVKLIRIEHTVLGVGPCQAYSTVSYNWGEPFFTEDKLALLKQGANKFFSGTKGKQLYDRTPAFLESPVLKAFFILDDEVLSAFANMPGPAEDGLLGVSDDEFFGFTSETAMYEVIEKSSPLWSWLEALGFVIKQLTLPSFAVRQSKSKLQAVFNSSKVTSSIELTFPTDSGGVPN